MIKSRISFSPVFKNEMLYQKVIRRLGYTSEKEVKPEIGDSVKSVINQVLDQIEPAAWYRTSPILQSKDGEILGEDNFIIKSKYWETLLHFMHMPELLHCFVITIGRKIADKITALQKESISKAYYMDCLASELTENFADQLQKYLSVQLKKEGKKTTLRFSPGYCDWNLKSGNEALFNFISPSPEEVWYRDTGIINPRKSISAVFISAAEIEKKGPCSICPNEQCLNRR